MPRKGNSLLGGRHREALSQTEVTRAVNTFLGMDTTINARHEVEATTSFREVVDGDGGVSGEIVFGPDIYPGRAVADPNSALSLAAAAAHELSHYYRWRDKTELPFGKYDNLDEAQTSLEAILRYERNLQHTELLQLVRDALQRIQLFINEQEDIEAEG